MKTGSSVLPLLVLLAGGTAFGQSAPEGDKSLAATLEVYAFPKEGQNTSQQSQDEAACYDWAVSTSGNDPFKLRKQGDDAMQQAAQQAEAVEQSTRGAGARGAVGGAAAGALIGEIASDDAGEGAAYGAAIGLIAARRSARRHASEAESQIVAQTSVQEQATAEQIENFKKAFSACLEGKDYLVKF